MSDSQNWQLIFAAGPFRFAVRCDDDAVTAAAYLPKRGKTLPPQNILAAECQKQIAQYFRRPRRFVFSLPLAAAATAHQKRVREIISSIPAGETLTYGAVAAQLRNSSARAVGGACRANAAPLFVPCHRVVGACGLGGFMGAGGEHALAVKKHLLQLEGAGQ